MMRLVTVCVVIALLVAENGLGLAPAAQPLTFDHILNYGVEGGRSYVMVYDPTSRQVYVHFLDQPYDSKEAVLHLPEYRPQTDALRARQALEGGVVKNVRGQKRFVGPMRGGVPPQDVAAQEWRTDRVRLDDDKEHLVLDDGIRVPLKDVYPYLQQGYVPRRAGVVIEYEKEELSPEGVPRIGSLTQQPLAFKSHDLVGQSEPTQSWGQYLLQPVKHEYHIFADLNSGQKVELLKRMAKGKILQPFVRAIPGLGQYLELRDTAESIKLEGQLESLREEMLRKNQAIAQLEQQQGASAQTVQTLKEERQALEKSFFDVFQNLLNEVPMDVNAYEQFLRNRMQDLDIDEESRSLFLQQQRVILQDLQEKREADELQEFTFQNNLKNMQRINAAVAQAVSLKNPEWGRSIDVLGSSAITTFQMIHELKQLGANASVLDYAGPIAAIAQAVFVAVQVFMHSEDPQRKLYEQIVFLRQTLNDFRQETHARLDHIEQMLGGLYSETMAYFQRLHHQTYEIDRKLGDLTDLTREQFQQTYQFQLSDLMGKAQMTPREDSVGLAAVITSAQVWALFHAHAHVFTHKDTPVVLQGNDRHKSRVELLRKVKSEELVGLLAHIYETNTGELPLANVPNPFVWAYACDAYLQASERMPDKDPQRKSLQSDEHRAQLKEMIQSGEQVEQLVQRLQTTPSFFKDLLDKYRDCVKQLQSLSCADLEKALSGQGSDSQAQQLVALDELWNQLRHLISLGFATSYQRDRFFRALIDPAHPYSFRLIGSQDLRAFLQESKNAGNQPKLLQHLWGSVALRADLLQVLIEQKSQKIVSGQSYEPYLVTDYTLRRLYSWGRTLFPKDAFFQVTKPRMRLTMSVDILLREPLYVPTWRFLTQATERYLTLKESDGKYSNVRWDESKPTDDQQAALTGLGHGRMMLIAGQHMFVTYDAATKVSTLWRLVGVPGHISKVKLMDVKGTVTESLRHGGGYYVLCSYKDRLWTKTELWRWEESSQMFYPCMPAGATWWYMDKIGDDVFAYRSSYAGGYLGADVHFRSNYSLFRLKSEGAWEEIKTSGEMNQVLPLKDRLVYVMSVPSRDTQIKGVRDYSIVEVYQGQVRVLETFAQLRSLGLKIKDNKTLTIDGKTASSSITKDIPIKLYLDPSLKALGHYYFKTDKGTITIYDAHKKQLGELQSSSVKGTVAGVVVFAGRLYVLAKDATYQRLYRLFDGQLAFETNRTIVSGDVFSGMSSLSYLEHMAQEGQKFEEQKKQLFEGNKSQQIAAARGLATIAQGYAMQALKHRLEWEESLSGLSPQDNKAVIEATLKALSDAKTWVGFQMLTTMSVADLLPKYTLTQDPLDNNSSAAVVQLKTYYGQAYLALAMEALQSGFYQDAQRQLSSALQLTLPDSLLKLELLFYRSVALFKLNREGDALSDLHQVTALAVTYGYPQGISQDLIAFFRGLVLLQTRQYDRAVTLFNEAIASNNDDFYYYYFRAQAYLRQEQWQSAVEDLSKVLELKPGDLGVHYDRARAYYQLRRYPEALQDIQKVLQAMPYDDESRDLLKMIQAYQLKDVVVSDAWLKGSLAAGTVAALAYVAKNYVPTEKLASVSLGTSIALGLASLESIYLRWRSLLLIPSLESVALDETAKTRVPLELLIGQGQVDANRLAEWPDDIEVYYGSQSALAVNGFANGNKVIWIDQDSWNSAALTPLARTFVLLHEKEQLQMKNQPRYRYQNVTDRSYERLELDSMIRTALLFSSEEGSAIVQSLRGYAQSLVQADLKEALQDYVDFLEKIVQNRDAIEKIAQDTQSENEGDGQEGYLFDRVEQQVHLSEVFSSNLRVLIAA